VKAYPPGCVVVLPGDTPHFHWAKSGEYVTQVTAIGPLGLEYLMRATIRGARAPSGPSHGGAQDTGSRCQLECRLARRTEKASDQG